MTRVWRKGRINKFKRQGKLNRLIIYEALAILFQLQIGLTSRTQSPPYCHVASLSDDRIDQQVVDVASAVVKNKTSSFRVVVPVLLSQFIGNQTRFLESVTTAPVCRLLK